LICLTTVPNMPPADLLVFHHADTRGHRDAPGRIPRSDIDRAVICF
jgi:hypothetical protein